VVPSATNWLCGPPYAVVRSLTSSRAGAGFGVQALVQGEGALGSLAKFALSFEKNLDLSELQLGN